MDYTLNVAVQSPAALPVHTAPLGRLLEERGYSGGVFCDESRLSVLSAILGFNSRLFRENHPDFVNTLRDSEFVVPGGEETREYWLAGAAAIRSTVTRLADGRTARVSRCWFGTNSDGSVSLDVALHMPEVRLYVSEGDEVNQGAVVTQQFEGGAFNVSVAPRIYRVVCSNGLRQFDRLGETTRSETPTLESIRVTVETALRTCLLETDRFERSVEMLREADDELVTDPEELLWRIEREAKVALQPFDRSTVIREFDLSLRRTRWDLLNTVTSQAHYAPDAKAARDLETLGGAIAKHRLGTHARPRSRRRVVTAATRGLRSASDRCA